MFSTLRRSALAGLVLSASALLFIGGSAFADNVEVDSTANIIEPLTIDLNDDADGLAFGDIVSGSQESTVTISTGGVRSLDSGDAVLAGGSFSEANIVVNGAMDHSYVLDLDDAVTLNSGSDSMTASLKSNSTQTLSGNGQEIFQVGGTLTVGADQPQGDYAGTFDVTVNYQ